MSSTTEQLQEHAAPAHHSPAAFESVLFLSGSSDAELVDREPAYFHDLNFDQIRDALPAGCDDFDLTPLFHTLPREIETIRYRQAVMRDLESPDIAAAIDRFTRQMAVVNKYERYSQRLGSVYQRQWSWHESCRVYLETVGELAAALPVSRPRSVALAALCDYLSDYVHCDRFAQLKRDTDAITGILAEVRYTIQIRGPTVSVDAYDGQADLADQVLSTFDRFRQGDVEKSRQSFRDFLALNHVEQQVLALVARRFAPQFTALNDYCDRHRSALSPILVRLGRELQLLLAYRAYIAPLRERGLPFCFPTISANDKTEQVRDAFDLALACQPGAQAGQIVTNDYELTGDERALVITGPNQGGKTTFARMFGQLHHLAALGLPVPGSFAQLFVPDLIFTHFERIEDPAAGVSRLEEELVRMGQIIDQASERSLVIMNESFASTATADGAEIGTRVLRSLLDRDVLCVYVTFIDELASASPKVVSMMSTVTPEDPTVRTFKLVRKPADGRAHAVALAHRYGLSYEQVQARLTR